MNSTLNRSGSVSDESEYFVHGRTQYSVHDGTQDPLNIVGNVAASVTIALIVIGVCGNFQVLLLIVRCPRLHRSFNAFIASLSLTDLAFNLAMMPFYVDAYVHRSWRFSQSFCRWHTFLGAMLIMSSGLHIGVIAVNRCMLIVHRTLYARCSTRRAVCVQLALVWLVAFLTVLPGILGHGAEVGFTDQVGRCNYVRHKSVVTLAAIFSIGFLLPCVVMCYSYVMICRQVVRSRLSLASHRRSSGGGVGGAHHPFGARPSFTSERAQVSNSETDGNTGLMLNVKGISCEHGNNLCVCEMSAETSLTSEEHRDCGAGAMRTDTLTGGKSAMPLTSAFSAQRCSSKKRCRAYKQTEDNRQISKNIIPDSVAEIKTAKRNRVGRTWSGGRASEHNRMDSVKARKAMLETEEQNDITKFESESEYAPDNDVAPIPSADVTQCDVTRPRVVKSVTRRGSLNSVRMIFVVFVTFVVTYIPFSVINMFANNSDLNRNWYIVTSLAFWAGSCVNPVIYGIMNKRFRQAYCAMRTDLRVRLLGK